MILQTGYILEILFFPINANKHISLQVRSVITAAYAELFHGHIRSLSGEISPKEQCKELFFCIRQNEAEILPA